MSSFKKENPLVINLLSQVRSIFSTIPDNRKKNVTVSLPDALMSALAMFSLKYPSLLKFDNERNEKIIKHNLETLYGIEKTPCDTQMREILDEVNPLKLREPFVSLLNEMQSSHVLENYKYEYNDNRADDFYVVAIDATGQYSSGTINCPECCVKNHSNGKIIYYHQLLAAVIVHPDKMTVIPFAPEAIIKENNASKNDCELNAAKRLLQQIKNEHPTLALCIVEDALFSNAPHIKLLKSIDYRFILGVKEDNHAYLFNSVQQHIMAGTDNEMEYYDKQLKRTRGFRFINNLSLNKSNQDVLVNFLEYWEINEKDEQVVYFTWITDIYLTKDTVFNIMKAGRARWKIENETFNTLKNQGYNLEHNYGHGKQHLSTVFAMLMMLAFLIDQIQECYCEFFQKAKEKTKARIHLWTRMQALFLTFFISDWNTFYLAIRYGHQGYKLEINIDNDIKLNTS